MKSFCYLLIIFVYLYDKLTWFKFSFSTSHFQKCLKNCVFIGCLSIFNQNTVYQNVLPNKPTKTLLVTKKKDLFLI